VMIAAEVNHLLRLAKRKRWFVCTISPASLSANPYPFAYTSFPCRVIAMDMPGILYLAIKVVMSLSISGILTLEGGGGSVGVTMGGSTGSGLSLPHPVYKIPPDTAIRITILCRSTNFIIALYFMYFTCYDKIGRAH